MPPPPESARPAGAVDGLADVAARWRRYLADLESLASEPLPLEMQGRLVRVTGPVLEAAGIRLPVGSVCEIHPAEWGGDAAPPVVAEVVGFSGDRAFLMPTCDLHGLSSGALVVPRRSPVMALKLGRARQPRRRIVDRTLHLPAGDGLLGRVVDPQGQPIDHKGALGQVHEEPLTRRPINALDRDPVRTPLDTGVRAINALLTIGRGQRIGLFAGSGVGKSVLLEMIARHATADVIVVALIGQRGREVGKFIEGIVGDDGFRRSVVVAAPADAPPLLRVQGANYASAIAEHFRDRGKNVLLLMDSLTSYAMAQREIALAIGEPPAGRGYPPSCFAKLPQLVERSGNGRAADQQGGGGSITAFYTVLAEADDPDDPIVAAAHGILDGHIVLSRELAEAGHYPAIDVERSVSRAMGDVAAIDHLDSARRFRQLHARHRKARDLSQLRAHAPGQDAELDLAVRLHAPMTRLLQQDRNEAARLDDSLAYLHAVLAA
ncbi:MAG: FliI/YscN family ATPase [Caldimonas sp.]